MNNELNNMRRPIRLRIIWVAVYFVTIALFITFVGVSVTQIRTHILPTGSVKLKVPYSKYLVGEIVSFTIKNNYNSSIYITNKCPDEPLAVYRQENGKWVRQHDQASLESCINEKRQVNVVAGGIVNGNFAPWHNLFNRPGKYRIVAFVEHYNLLPYQDIEIAKVVEKTPTSQARIVVPTPNIIEQDD